MCFLLHSTFAHHVIAGCATIVTEQPQADLVPGSKLRISAFMEPSAVTIVDRFDRQIVPHIFRATCKTSQAISGSDGQQSPSISWNPAPSCLLQCLRCLTTYVLSSAFCWRAALHAPGSPFPLEIDRRVLPICPTTWR